ncbi:MAG: tail fiber assembly protein, partial [Pantoea sp.]|nr:tail fiber assembly protein [Pantoea sp.]
MTKYYSPSVNAFYSIDINGTSIPEDAVEITHEAWLELLKQQSDGKVIAAGNDGIPVANDAPPLTTAQMVEIADNQ